MRLIAGRFGGRALTPVGKGDPAAHLRPTTDRVRESLFSILTGGRFGDPISEARVLDLFAGTGALGFEALSRGAMSVTFVETGRVGQRLLAQNQKLLGLSAEVTVIKRDATRFAPPFDAPFDLVFLDPPYGKGLGEKALTTLLQAGAIAPEALIVWEENHTPAPPDGLELLDSRKFGDSMISFLAPVA